MIPNQGLTGYMLIKLKLQMVIWTSHPKSTWDMATTVPLSLHWTGWVKTLILSYWVYRGGSCRLARPACVFQKKKEKKDLEICHELSILNSKLTVTKKQFNIMMLKCEQCHLLGSNYLTLWHIAWVCCSVSLKEFQQRMNYTKGEYLAVCAFCLSQALKKKPYPTSSLNKDHLLSSWSEILVHDFPQ